MLTSSGDTYQVTVKLIKKHTRRRKSHLDKKMKKMFRKHPNLYCDLSTGSGYNARSCGHDYLKILYEFQDNVLYGRDYFDNIHKELLDSMDLPTAMLEKLYSGKYAQISAR